MTRRPARAGRKELYKGRNRTSRAGGVQDEAGWEQAAQGPSEWWEATGAFQAGVTSSAWCVKRWLRRRVDMGCGHLETAALLAGAEAQPRPATDRLAEVSLGAQVSNLEKCE